MSIDATTLKPALARWCDAMEAATPELNALDGRLGDGDLGTTLQRCAQLMREAAPGMPGEIGAIFKACAAACAKASGSSFGTLLAVAFLTAAKNVQGRESLDGRMVAQLLDTIVQALAARGGAALGDKTMLDSLDAIARALHQAGEGADLRAVVRDAAQQACNAMRDKPNRIGRARMFAEKSMGADDPGMVAVLRMAASL